MKTATYVAGIAKGGTKYLEKKTTFTGGHFEYEETTLIAHRIMRLSIVVAILICIYTLYRLADPDVVDTATIGSEPETTFYLREIAFLLVSLSIPLCGYYGSKYQQLRTLRVFCLSSFGCSILLALWAGITGGTFCSFVATCNTAAVSAIFVYLSACVLYAVVSYFSSDILFLERHNALNYGSKTGTADQSESINV